MDYAWGREREGGREREREREESAQSLLKLIHKRQYCHKNGSKHARCTSNFVSSMRRRYPTKPRFLGLSFFSHKHTTTYDIDTNILKPHSGAHTNKDNMAPEHTSFAVLLTQTHNHIRHDTIILKPPSGAHTHKDNMASEHTVSMCLLASNRWIGNRSSFAFCFTYTSIIHVLFRLSIHLIFNFPCLLY